MNVVLSVFYRRIDLNYSEKKTNVVLVPMGDPSLLAGSA
jgi:hypothetical protein